VQPNLSLKSAMRIILLLFDIDHDQLLAYP